MGWDSERLKIFREVLANTYPTVADSRMIASDAGLNLAAIAFQDRADTNWYNIVTNAKQNGGLDKLLDEAAAANPSNDILAKLGSGAPLSLPEGPVQLDWKGSESKSALEKIIGKRSTLVPITYLERGLLKARAVVKIRRADGSSGTGFVTDGNMVLTNNHVIPTADIAAACTIQFNYQETADGLSAEAEELTLDAASFRTSANDDWTLIRANGNPQAKWGALPIGDTDTRVGDYVNIIGHPGGGQKQVSLSANVVVFADNTRVQYLTDTLPGSSGSPVFDAQWNVIALHHSGGWLVEPNAKTKTTYYRNEGISAKLIKSALAQG